MKFRPCVYVSTFSISSGTQNNFPPFVEVYFAFATSKPDKPERVPRALSPVRLSSYIQRVFSVITRPFVRLKKKGRSWLKNTGVNGRIRTWLVGGSLNRTMLVNESSLFFFALRCNLCLIEQRFFLSAHSSGMVARESTVQ